VRIEGPSQGDGSGTALRIFYNEDVVGPAASVTVIDADTRKLVIMGQTIIIDKNTNFADTALLTVAAGNVLEVSGLLDDQGFLRAGYLKKRADAYTLGSEVQVRGKAAEVNAQLRTFS
jgi:hypothetical protein